MYIWKIFYKIICLALSQCKIIITIIIVNINKNNNDNKKAARRLPPFFPLKTHQFFSHSWRLEKLVELVIDTVSKLITVYHSKPEKN